MENSEKAKLEIEATLIVIKSIEFLERQAAELLYELDELQDRWESSFCPEEKEKLLQKIGEKAREVSIQSGFLKFREKKTPRQYLQKWYKKGAKKKIEKEIEEALKSLKKENG